MKQKDWLIIAVVVIIAATLSIVLSGKLFAPPKKEKVEVIGAIQTDFPELDTKYFNASSVNPTQLIQIGNNSNALPFKNN